MAAATSPRPSRYPTTIYTKPGKKIFQGDIVFGFHHQLRGRSAERRAPGPDDYISPGIPYFGEAQDRLIEVVLPDGGTTQLVVRLWFGPFVVLHQNCEIEQCDPEDSRLKIAPIVFEKLWPDGPWDLIRSGTLPGYLYLPDINPAERAASEFEPEWGDAAVVFASATASSKGLANKKNRTLRLSAEMIPLLQEAQVRADSVRGWASIEDEQNWVGKRITAVEETAETVFGLTRLAKIFLEGADGDVEEATVAWGLRDALKRQE